MPPPEPRSSTVSPSLQVGDRDRVAAAERGERRRLGQLAALLGVVQRLAELGRVALAVRNTSRCRSRSSILRVTARADSA